MVEVNRMTTPANMRWKLVDRGTGAENAQIDWTFHVGDQVKLRLVNEMDSDHPMPHPFHVHGAGRFLILARDGRASSRTSSGRTPCSCAPARSSTSCSTSRTRTVDGALPHRRASRERDDVELQRRSSTGVSVAGLAQPVRAGLRAPVIWGLVVGAAQAASPLAFWWLDTATAYALGLALIASVYIGFAVADGRATVLAVETGVASMFRHHRRRCRDRNTVVARRRLAGHGSKGPLAAPATVRCQHALVASLLPRGRLDGRSDHRRRDRRRRAFPPLALT
jgi:hypothetical protein